MLPPTRECTLLAFALFSSGCHSPPGVEHPVAAFQTRPISPTSQIRIAEPAGETAIGDSLSVFTSSDAGTVSIGALESPLEQVFGDIRSIQTDRNGRIYVLDGSASEVRVFDASGEFLMKVGGPGYGPGEFAHPHSLVVDDLGQLYVGDMMSKVHVFESLSEGFRYVRSLAVGVEPLDMCILGSTLYIHGVGLKDNRVIHPFELDGRRREPFGSIYRSGNPMVNQWISRGWLACDETSGMLAFAPVGGVGEVRGYTSDGKLSWLTVIPDFHPIDMRETPSGYAVERPVSGFNTIRAITAIPGNRFIIQVAFSTRDGMARGVTYERLHTFLLNSSSGEGTKLGESFPAIRMYGGSRSISSIEDPFPRVLVNSTFNN